MLMRNFLALLKDTFWAWSKDKASRWAAALAYYAVFATAPLLIIIIAVIGFFYGERAAQNEIAHEIENLVGSQLAFFLQNVVANLQEQGGGFTASIISIVTVFFGASGLFSHLQDALNSIWDVPPSGEKGLTHFIKNRVILFSLVMGLGGLILFYQFFSLLFSTFLNYFGASTAIEQVNHFISFVMLSIFFALLFRILPDINIPWRDVWLGGSVTAVFFTLGRFIIQAYMSNRNIGTVYGAAGSIIVFLLWVYYSAQIFLFGAEFTHLYACRYGSYSNHIKK